MFFLEIFIGKYNVYNLVLFGLLVVCVNNEISIFGFWAIEFLVIFSVYL